MYEPRPVSGSLAVSIFLSVTGLHWLLWRFIIPAQASLPTEASSFFFRREGSGFFNGSTSLGYMMVALDCFSVAGGPGLTDGGAWMAHFRGNFLLMGLFWIGLGTAFRLRAAFALLGATPAAPRATTCSTPPPPPAETPPRTSGRARCLRA